MLLSFNAGRIIWVRNTYRSDCEKRKNGFSKNKKNIRQKKLAEEKTNK
jgi:hypothetical protein